uniref:N-terminal methionine N(alpha)-acetyltransferase NatE n=1 Tax=Schistosoma japonicum TaxID=6182 RepID=C1LF26_SCHJA|nr:N-acetyltransferase NAT13 [Schistosoma japonicum]
MIAVRTEQIDTVEQKIRGNNASKMYKKIELGQLTPHNIKQFRLINQTVFPVTYTEKFYSDVLKNSKMCRLAYFNDIVVGAVSYRIENVVVKNVDLAADDNYGQTSQTVKKCYIMTLGCLAPYRGYGVGTLMLKHVIKSCLKHGGIKSIYLHVHVGNEGAVAFYKRFGFEITGEVNDYYRRIHPQTAYVLERCLSATETRESDSESD